ncbi:hypothetical protein D9613_006618 [Agrocybe pediades]|uniref:TEA domain-containing protein n=1 Tax=Agrocybe pediades TaxID=84607 RepID=A0A8H4VHR1_9AGAR|nr:hypothetical protein D9613_006618 [Agrocybe pediades]
MIHRARTNLPEGKGASSSTAGKSPSGPHGWKQLSSKRFPRRNQMIAEFILAKTKVRRTAKQVGSRLQQLRESCTDEYILNLIQSKVFGLERRGRSLARFSTLTPDNFWDSSSQSSPARIETYNISSSSLPTHRPVRIEVILALHEFDLYASTTCTTPAFTLDLDEGVLAEPSSPTYPSSTFTRRAEIRTANAMSQCSPIVNFSSHTLAQASTLKCASDVYCNGERVSSSATYLEPCSADGASTSSSSFSCRAFFLPEFWHVLASNEDCRAFTVTQNIISESDAGSSILFTIDYTFECAFDIQVYDYSVSSLSPPISPTYPDIVCSQFPYDYYPHSNYPVFDNTGTYTSTSNTHSHTPSTLLQPSHFDMSLHSASHQATGSSFESYASFY